MATDNFCHWIITSTYIKVSFETRMLIDKNTYIKSAAELVKVDRFRCFLTTSNVIISVLILLISITAYFGVILDKHMLHLDTVYSSFVLQIGCLFAWAWILIRLYKDIEHSEKLLPNKRIFILHASLLSVYLLL